MRVLVVTPWFPSDDAPGAGIFNLRDAEAIAVEHEVTVLHIGVPNATLSATEPFRHITQQISVIRAPYNSRSADSVRRIAALVRQLADEHDLIHTMAFSAIVPVTAARVSKPWVHTEHWSGLVRRSPTLKTKLIRPFLPLLKRVRFGEMMLLHELNRPDVVVAVSESLAAAIANYRRGAIEVIGNHVSVAPQLHETSHAGSDDASVLRIAAVGNLIDHKGPLQLIEAVSDLKRQGITAEVTWAGTGELADVVTTRSIELNIQNQVKLIGFVKPAELSRVLQAADLFVLPTAGETFGIALAEALANGLPVVTSGDGGHHDFLPPQASRIVRSREPAAIAAAIVDLMTDSERWSTQQIREYAAQIFSEAERRARYRRVYESVAPKR